MEQREPEMILGQLKTYGALHAKELPTILLNPKLDEGSLNLKRINTVYAIGDGDSLYAAQAVSYGFKTIAKVNYIPLPAFEFLYYVLPYLGSKPGASVLLIGISASGGSLMVIKAIQECRLTYPGIKTIGIYGKEDSLLAKEAEYLESVQLEELGRTPGIRTYAASLAGLFSIACSIGEAKNIKSDPDRNGIARFVKDTGPSVEKTIEAANIKGADLANLADGPFISCIGTGPDQGSASFSGAKIVEASGVYAVGQDLEEWNHVESFAYPLDTAMIVFANPGPAFKRAASLIHAGKALGHRMIVVNPEEIHDFDTVADAVIPVFGPYHPLLSPFTHYLPGTVLAYYLAKKLNRAMFMSDRNQD
jgi:glucosamine--fructose-6-phosphate aminotransferase (isomerizing)